MNIAQPTSIPLSERVQAAKQRLPLPDLMQYLAVGEYAKASCRSPLREDKNPSWGIFHRDGQWLWKDHGTGESGDEVTFVEQLQSCSKAEAMRRFCQMAGIDAPPLSSSKPSRKGKPNIPKALKPQAADIAALSELRNVSLEAVRAALDAGLLFFCNQSGHAAWGVTDSTRQNVQLRRLDGKTWPIEWRTIGGKKAWTLKHSKAAWPLGTNEAQERPNVALVEGGADMLAAFHFVHLEDKVGSVSPVCILGASNDIPTNALSHFEGKHIRIFGHNDDAGQAAVKRWGRQLIGAGATADAFSFSGINQANGEPVLDLNDFCNISPDDFEDNRHLWEILP